MPQRRLESGKRALVHPQRSCQRKALELLDEVRPPEDNSCLPKAARTAGYSFADLVLRVVDEAAARYGISGLAAGAAARGRA